MQKGGAPPRTQGHDDKDELEVKKADPRDVGKVEHLGHGLRICREGPHTDRLVELGVELGRRAIQDNDCVAWHRVGASRKRDTRHWRRTSRDPQKHGICRMVQGVAEQTNASRLCNLVLALLKDFRRRLTLAVPFAALGRYLHSRRCRSREPGSRSLQQYREASINS